MIYQTLQNNNKTIATKEYVVEDNSGLFISFNTAQETFDWIAVHTPGIATNVRIEHRTLTEGEITFTPRLDISYSHQQCDRCGRVFNDVHRRYYPCPEHPSV